MRGADERNERGGQEAGEGPGISEGPSVAEEPDISEEQTAPGDGKDPVRAKAALIDPASMRVVWVNESAAQVLENRVSGPVDSMTLDQLVPMAESLGVPEALRVASDTGAPQHMRADVISMTRGNLSIVASVYRLPDGMLLLLSEHAWHMERPAEGTGAPRRGRGAARGGGAAGGSARSGR